MRIDDIDGKGILQKKKQKKVANVTLHIFLEFVKKCFLGIKIIMVFFPPWGGGGGGRASVTKIIGNPQLSK